MKLVHMTMPGRLEVAYLWLPAWLGINRKAVDEINGYLKDRVVGVEVTEPNLSAINEGLIDFIVEKYPIKGLRDYLDGLKFVNV